LFNAYASLAHRLTEDFFQNLVVKREAGCAALWLHQKAEAPITLESVC